jgi:hypothetical protein
MNSLNDDGDIDSDGAMGGPAGVGVGVDALTLLREDHRDEQDLFDAYRDAVDANADDGRRRELAAEICALLEIHALIEEQFYPAARDALPDADLLLDRAEVARATAKDLIDYVAQHIRGEEDEISPRVETSELDLGELGAELQARRTELEQDADI